MPANQVSPGTRATAFAPTASVVQAQHDVHPPPCSDLLGHCQEEQLSDEGRSTKLELLQKVLIARARAQSMSVVTMTAAQGMMVRQQSRHRTGGLPSTPGFIPYRDRQPFSCDSQPACQAL